jgi:hypothetical protein
MSKPRGLPLNDRRWLPVVEAHARFQRLDNPHAAANHLSTLLQTSVHSMVHWLVPEGGPDRELLSFAYWHRNTLRMGSKGLAVFPPYSMDGMSGAVFYAWEPDLKKFFGDQEPAGNSQASKNILPANDTITAAPAQDLKMPTKRGRKREHAWDKIRTETMRRVFNNGRPEWPQSENKLAEKIEQWCLDRFKKAPAISELRAMVADVVERLRALIS